MSTPGTAQSNPSDLIVGIDLGTTNSSIGYVRAGTPRLVDIDGSPLLPSVVGLGPDGALLVGQSARNQRHLFPEATISSVKRRMGEDTQLQLGERAYTPAEISAMILRRLKTAAEADLGHAVTRAVITVPAYFSDAQRTATRDAGQIAGLTVERIVNEPTAAALAYAHSNDRDGTFVVYDLGGGTFDVSVIRKVGEVTEVLASTGDAKLGGDDFDALLFDRLRARFERSEGGDVRSDLRALARLMRAAEGAKITLSDRGFVTVTEEHLLSVDGVGRHLDMEVSRAEYEDLIAPMIGRTLDSVTAALGEARLLPSQVDDVILVGGSTRTPRIAALLQDALGRAPRMDIDPDKAVALGAAMLGARIAGDDSGRILVDVTPYSFGPSHLGELNGRVSSNCYMAVIRRNTPIPCRRTEVFYTAYRGQKQVDVKIFQGESRDARDNLLIGRFLVEGLDPDASENSPIVFELALDLSGMLQVTVTEKETGLRKEFTIEDALRALDDEAIAAARERLREAMDEADFGIHGFGSDDETEDEDEDEDEGGGEVDARTDSKASARGASARPSAPEQLAPDDQRMWEQTTGLIEKAERLLPSLDADDRAEVDELIAELHAAMLTCDMAALRKNAGELADALFYLES